MGFIRGTADFQPFEEPDRILVDFRCCPELRASHPRLVDLIKNLTTNSTLKESPYDQLRRGWGNSFRRFRIGHLEW